MDGQAAFRLGVLGLLVGVLLVLAAGTTRTVPAFLANVGLAVGLLAGATGAAVVVDGAGD